MNPRRQQSCDGECRNCGAVLGAQELARGQCPYCGIVHAHQVRAIEAAAAAAHLLADRNSDGVPDVLEGSLTGAFRRRMAHHESLTPKEARAMLLVLLVGFFVIVTYFALKHGAFAMNELLAP
jgi:hypothetical protein